MARLAPVQERTLDTARAYWTWTGIPRKEVWVDKDGQAHFPTGTALTGNPRLVVHLQDGCFFDEQGRLLENSSVPRPVRDILEKAQTWNPTPGVTHPGIVRECPVKGCSYRTVVANDMQRHLSRHEGLSEADRTDLLGRAMGMNARWNAGDFLDPQVFLQRGAAPTGVGDEEAEAEGDS